MIRRVSLAAAVLAITLAASSSTAHAEEEWYGYQVAVTDVAGWAMVIAGGKLEAWQLAAVGAGAIFFGGPIVHAAHENYGRMGLSFGARIVGPLAGFGIGAALDRNSRSFLPAGPFIGAFIGYLAGALTDIIVVAREDDDPAQAPRMLSFGGRF